MIRLDISQIKSTHFQTALEFASDLISGKKIANLEQIHACQRFLDDLQRDDLDFKSNQFDFAINLIEGTIFPEKGEKYFNVWKHKKPFVTVYFWKRTA